MKKSTLTGLLALGLMEVSAATPAVAQGTAAFTGNYAGTHTGYFTGDANFSSRSYAIVTPGPGTAPARNDSFDFSGNLYGVHGGVNLPLGTNVIGGLESDFTNLGDKDTVSFSSGVIGADGLSFQYRSELEFNWQSTIRGRLGFVAGNILFFGTAGVAFLDVDWSETASKSLNFGTPVVFNHSKSDTLVGGVVGGGVEIAISPTIIIGSDYLYENFGSFNSIPHGVEAGQTGKIGDIDVHKVRVRVSVKFGGPPQ